MWPVWLHHIFPHYHINRTIFGKRLLNLKCVMLLSLQLFPKTVLIPRRIQHIGLHVKCLFFMSDIKETWIFSTDFRNKSSNIKFHKNPSSGSRVVPRGRTDGQRGSRKDGQPYMSKLAVAFRNFADAPKNSMLYPHTAFISSTCISEQTAIIYLYSVTCFYNSEGVCLLCGTNWAFKYNSG